MWRHKSCGTNYLKNIKLCSSVHLEWIDLVWSRIAQKVAAPLENQRDASTGRSHSHIYEQ